MTTLVDYISGLHKWSVSVEVRFMHGWVSVRLGWRTTLVDYISKGQVRFEDYVSGLC